jgi:hypothetical protein
VLDEPFAGLDARTQGTLAGLLAERRDGGAAAGGDGQVEVGAADEVGEEHGIDRLRVAAADIDATLRDLLGRGRHILRVAPRSDGTVTIEARPGR